jgi:hypothetical protein
MIWLKNHRKKCLWLPLSYFGKKFIWNENQNEKYSIQNSFSQFYIYVSQLLVLYFWSKDLWSSYNGSSSAQRSGTAGYSDIGLVCTPYRYSIAEEIGGFAHVPVVAHEVAHKWIYNIS